ncbi:MAG: protein kinase [Lachnospiraceae bacterium]|nr:protein kinase [Lachnospiraceae bacterium]
MLKTGAFLQNRYEIVSRIGSGGMADVYKAKDHKLNRFVAVKVLKQEFREDKEFLSKFRVEAQSAAGLSHPNIVNVYDVGEDQGINFIVMELVEGISLKNYIGKKGKLSVREATSIALQVAAGLETAHNNEIVHRDVKPENIIISLNGKVKIADFGIARAASSKTINSSAMGSVHYSSPEQTRGGYSDAKSDIYSMGITLYEMLTGRVPYDGDTAVEVALKHMQEEMPSPCRLSPEVPLSTEQIVMKCTQKSPDRRYNNMAEVIRDLKESLVNPDGDFVVIPTVDRTAQTVLLSKEEVNQIKNSTLPSYDPNMDTGAAGSLGIAPGIASVEEGRGSAYSGSYYQNTGYQNVRRSRDPQPVGDSPLDLPPYDPFEEFPDDEYEYGEPGFEEDSWDQPVRGKTPRRRTVHNTRLEKILIITGVVAAVSVVLVILGILARSIGLFGGGIGSAGTDPSVSGVSTGLVTVPKLLEQEEAAAQKMLTDLNLEYVFQGEVPSTYAKGLVVAQSVEAGTSVEVGSRIGYSISSGNSNTLKVPPLENLTQEEANNALTGMGLLVSVDTTRYSDTVESGHVITTNPGAGSDVASGSTVTIYVSQGNTSAMVEVPGVVDHYVEDARAALTNLGLYVYISEESSDTVAKGLVISQDIVPGTLVQTGSSVTLTASAGAPGQSGQESVEDEVWKCYVQLSAPENWNGEPVRIVLTQGETTTTVFEGTTEFPFFLSVEGEPGETTGTVYVYTLAAGTGEVMGTTQYDGVKFEAEQE